MLLRKNDEFDLNLQCEYCNGMDAIINYRMMCCVIDRLSRGLHAEFGTHRSPFHTIRFVSGSPDLIIRQCKLECHSQPVNMWTLIEFDLSKIQGPCILELPFNSLLLHQRNNCSQFPGILSVFCRNYISIYLSEGNSQFSNARILKDAICRK